jgi:hypothetical protein
MLSPDLISRKCETCGAGRKTPPDGDQRAGPIRSRRFRIKRLGQILSPASRVASAASPADEEGERSGAGHRPSDRGSAGYAGRAIVFPDEAGSVTVGRRGGCQSILTHSIADLTRRMGAPDWSAVIEPHQQVCSPPSGGRGHDQTCTRSRQRQRIAAPLFWIAHRAPMAGRDLATGKPTSRNGVLPASIGQSPMFLRERTSTG